jgi:hypothetical protein
MQLGVIVDQTRQLCYTKRLVFLKPNRCFLQANWERKRAWQTVFTAGRCSMEGKTQTVPLEAPTLLQLGYPDKLAYPKAAQLRSSEASMNSAVYTSKVAYSPLELKQFNALLCELTRGSRCVVSNLSCCPLCFLCYQGLPCLYDILYRRKLEVWLNWDPLLPLDS